MYKRQIIGVVRSVSGAGAQITLTDVGNAANFDNGDQIGAVQSSGADRGSAIGTISQVNRETGVLAFVSGDVM